MTLTFSSLEEAWGGKSIQTQTQQKSTRTPGHLLSNVSQDTSQSVHSNTFQTPLREPPQPMKRVSTDKYENIYCNTIINHVQGCAYCQERLRSIFKKHEPAPVAVVHSDTLMTPEVLKRKHDNLAYVPFGLEPEVFNILLFSSILIALIFLIDKKGVKSFKF